jgi:hypothetical protein
MDRVRHVVALQAIVQRLPETEVKGKLRGILVSLRLAADDDGLFRKIAGRFEKEVNRAASADPLFELKEAASGAAREVDEEPEARIAS